MNSSELTTANELMTTDLFGIVGKVIAGTYRVEEVVAEGGFGVVYRAHHKGFRAKVALKCLKIPAELGRQYYKQFLEQFRSEAEVLFRLSALMPNIVRPLHVDAFQSPDGRFVPFMALEWLDGWTLDAVIAQRAAHGRRPIPLWKLVGLLTPVARSLEQAHNMPGPEGTMSIVHRDMKPENLFVALIGGEQVVKILDFGISKVKNTAGQMVGRASQTVGELVSFSPAYGAPEQWLPKRYGQTGPWTDVWGMALTMVEAIKGHDVVEGDQAAMMGTVIDPERRPTPRNEGVKVNDDVERVFTRALAVDPRDRYQSMRAFWDELLTALDLDPQGMPKRAKRVDPRAEGPGVGASSEQLEAALSGRITGISGLQPAVQPEVIDFRDSIPEGSVVPMMSFDSAVALVPKAPAPAKITSPDAEPAPRPSASRAAETQAELPAADSASDGGAPVAARGAEAQAPGAKTFEETRGDDALDEAPVPSLVMPGLVPDEGEGARNASGAIADVPFEGALAPRPELEPGEAESGPSALVSRTRDKAASEVRSSRVSAVPRSAEVERDSVPVATLPSGLVATTVQSRGRAPSLGRSPRRSSLMVELLPALAMLLLSIALTFLDLVFATKSGSMLTIGPVRATWIGAGCLIGAIALGVSSVRRHLR